MVKMASGTSTSTKETSSGIIEHVMDTGSGGRQQASSTKENKQKESEKKSTSHTDSSSAVGKDDVSDIVSQTKSGSAPVSVISSAQSMDPTKKDSGKTKEGVFVYDGY